METKDELLKILKDTLPYLKSEFGVRRIGIFGSFSAGNPDENSDIDLIAEFERPIGLRFVELANYMEHVFQRKTDILTPGGLETIRNPKIAAEIKRTVIYV